MKFLIAFLFFVSLPCAAQKGWMAADMLKYCEQAELLMTTNRQVSLSDASTCIGFIFGLSSGVTVEAFYREQSRQKAFCLPDDANILQQIRVTLKWLRENPEKHHMPAYATVTLALRSAFPCEPASYWDSLSPPPSR